MASSCGAGDVEPEAPIVWPPDAKSQLIERDPMLGKILGRGRKGRQRIRWLDGITPSLNWHEFEQAPEDSEGQESLLCLSSWGRKDLDTT